MLKVFTGCWGDKYPARYIDRMRSMLECYVGVPYIYQPITEATLPGWWGKLAVLDNSGPALWIDIDSVITGPILPLLKPLNADIRTAKNWAQSGHGGCQSSVMYWEDATPITRLFHPDQIGDYWGDQEFITALRDRGDIKVEYFDEPLVKSYKYHARNGIPPGASVVTFHGKPDPHECGGWVSKCWG